MPLLFYWVCKPTKFPCHCDDWGLLQIFCQSEGRLGPWESPGTMSVSALHFGGSYQEIATSLRSSQ